MSLREIRHRAYTHLSQYWVSKPYSHRSAIKQGAYRWAARQLGMNPHAFHFHLLSYEQCERLIELCQKEKVGLIEGPGFVNKTTPADDKYARRRFSKKVSKSRDRRMKCSRKTILLSRNREKQSD